MMVDVCEQKSSVFIKLVFGHTRGDVCVFRRWPLRRESAAGTGYRHLRGEEACCEDGWPRGRFQGTQLAPLNNVPKPQKHAVLSLSLFNTCHHVSTPKSFDPRNAMYASMRMRHRYLMSLKCIFD